MEFGRLCSWEQQGNRIEFTFENGSGRLEVVTDRILNIFSGRVSNEHRSKAIEGEKAVETRFSASEENGVVTVSTDCVTAKVCDGFFVDFYKADGTVLCRDRREAREVRAGLSDELKALKEAEGHSVEEEGAGAVEVVKCMEGGEAFYGLGDKTGFMNKRGYEYVMWNTDDPSPQMDNFKSLYKSIPFFITLRDDAVFGLFYDNSYRSCFDMGKESDDYYWYGAADGNLDYYLIAGDSMAEVVSGYTYLTGTAPLPQKWTLGYQQCRWSYMSEAEVRDVAGNMRRCGIPCDVIHLDIDYMDRYKVFTWTPDKERYPNPEKLISDLSEDGIKIVTIIDPGVKVEEGYSVYDEGVENDYFAKTPEGDIYVNEVWPGDAVYPDFGKEEVRGWWGRNQQFLIDKGVRGVWNDMNEPASFRGQLPSDVVFTDEDEVSDHARMHNLYGHNMAKATYEGLKERDGRRPFVITRACYAGTQKYSTAWTGDNHSIWAHLQMVIPQLCNMGLSGMPFVGTDVGGFGSDCTKELLCRWVEAGCFSPLFRNHSAMGTRYQEPWQFDEETVRIYRKAVELRYHLIPYYYDLFWEEEKTGLPIMRPLVLHYEKDETARECNTEFLVGRNLLAAPVVTQGDRKKMVYLPAGVWYDYWTGERLESADGKWIVRDAPLDTCPLYVKAGTILPVWPKQSFVGEKDTDSVLMLEIYPGEGSWEHFQDDGESFDYRDGKYNQYHCELKGKALTVTCVHAGYGRKYEKVRAVCMGESAEGAFDGEGKCDVWHGMIATDPR
ncbi:MAG: glycoside hydrolase family 31 protein [Eisenbergiella sp.]